LFTSTVVLGSSRIREQVPDRAAVAAAVVFGRGHGGALFVGDLAVFKLGLGDDAVARPAEQPRTGAGKAAAARKGHQKTHGDRRAAKGGKEHAALRKAFGVV
jgi:hypothetical protein